MQALSTEILVEVQQDLAVGAGTQTMARSLELLSNRLVTIELTVDDDPDALVFIGDWLIAGCEVDYSESRVTERKSAVPPGPEPFGGGGPGVQASRQRAGSPQTRLGHDARTAQLSRTFGAPGYGHEWARSVTHAATRAKAFLK